MLAIRGMGLSTQARHQPSPFHVTNDMVGGYWYPRVIQARHNY